MRLDNWSLCAAPGRVYNTGAELHLGESTLQKHVLYRNLSVLSHGPELPRLVLTTGAFASPRRVYTTGPELHLDMSTMQTSVLHLDEASPQGPKLHPDPCFHNFENASSHLRILKVNLVNLQDK
jgi:hypothetical protein